MAKTLIVMMLEVISGVMLGRIAIPVLRRIKTGKFEIYVGDRFKQDGSEPSGGGAVILLTVMIGVFAGGAAMELDARSIRGILCTMMFAAALTAVGMAEDYIREVRGGIGMKSLHRMLIKLTLCGCFTAVMKLCGFECRVLLLPFRWGAVDMGMAYIPLTAVIMTIMITAAEVCDCQRGVHDTGIDGLCCMTMFVGFLGPAAAFGTGSNETARLMSICAAAGCGAFEVWGISPAKLYPGRSGGLLLGGLMCGIMVISGMPIAVWLAMAMPLAELAVTALQRAVFAANKKLLFKGATLHEHLRNIGWSDQKIMILFAVLQLMFCIGAAAYAVYGSKFILD